MMHFCMKALFVASIFQSTPIETIARNWEKARKDKSEIFIGYISIYSVHKCEKDRLIIEDL